MLATLRDAADSRDITMSSISNTFGNRGVFHKGWTAVTKHRTPWKADAPPPFDDDVWELRRASAMDAGP